MALIIIAHNITNLAPVSDYDYAVLVGDGSPERSKTIVQGRVEGHERAAGWKALVQRILNESK